ncbi:MAG TPA: discoidin domain-containing protein [Myxococcales bacterium]|jgi:hypothetical protein
MRKASWALLVPGLLAWPALADETRAAADAGSPGREAPRPRAEGSAHIVAHDLPKPIDEEAHRTKPADVPVPPLPEGDAFTRLRGRLKVAASTLYEGWPAEKAVDGDPKTSWFSASGDAAALKTKPWLEVTFPEDVTVQHVMALGNREPHWLVNYSIVVARIELYDAQGKQLASQGNETAVPTFDIEFHFKAPVRKVRRLRFLSQADQGDRNPYRDIAVAELRAW